MSTESNPGFFDALAITLEHPWDALVSVFSPGPKVKGPPDVTPGYVANLLGVSSGAVVSDSLGSGRTRAFGVDPLTGGLIAPQYAGSAAAAGYDASNPGAFIARVNDEVTQDFARDSGANNGAGSPAADISGIVIFFLLVALVLVLKEAF